MGKVYGITEQTMPTQLATSVQKATASCKQNQALYNQTMNSRKLNGTINDCQGKNLDVNN